MAATRTVKPGMLLTETGYHVTDVAGAYVGSTTDADVAGRWWLAGIGSGYAPGTEPPRRDLQAGGPRGVHIVVKRESGFVAGWNLPDVAAAEVFAGECNRASEGRDPARVVTWDDSVWDAVLCDQ